MSGGLVGETRERFKDCPECHGRGWHWGRDNEDAPVEDLGEFKEVYCKCPAGVLLQDKESR